MSHLSKAPASALTPILAAPAFLPQDRAPRRFPLAIVWRAMTINRKVALGSAILGFFVLVAFFGPLIITQDPLKYTLNLMAPPSATHLLGTNQGGQDVFSQLVTGTRSTLFWSLVSGVLVMLIAIAVGLVGGFFGGIVDDFLSLVTNVFLVIP